MKRQLFLLLLTLMATVATAATTFEQGNFKYTVNYDGTTVTLNGFSSSVTSAMTELTIPGYAWNASEQKRYQVKNIAAVAFSSTYARQITTLRINYGVESIGSSAFQYSSQLKFVYLPSSITSLGSSVFANCPIQTIFAALETMPTITSTTFQSMAVSATGSRYWWAGTTKGLNAANSNTYITNNFTVQKNAPTGCDATVTMGTSTNNTLTDVYVVVTEPTSNPNYLSADYAGKAKIIGASFRESNTSKTLNINKNYVDIDGVSYHITEIDNSAFEKTTTIKVLDTSESSYLQTIGTYAFHKCTSLTKVVLGNSVKTINNYAFYQCSALTTASVNAETIGDNAFFNCTSLSTLTLGSSVKTLGSRSFAYTAVTKVALPSGLTTYGAGAFASCSKLTGFTVSGSSTFANKSTAGYLEDAAHTTIIQYPAGLTSVSLSKYPYTTVKAYAFAGVQASVTLPYGVTTIEDYAFNGTKGSSVRIPSSVTKFGQKALYSLTVDNLILNSRTVPKYLSSYQLDLSYIAPLSPSKVTPTLSVPNGCEANYRANSTWNSTFNTINGWGYDDFAGSRYITVTSNSSYTDTNVQSTAAAGQAMVVKGFGTPSGALTLPDTYTNTYSGKTYIVSSIERETFRDLTGITSVSGGKGIKTVGQLAFAGTTGCTSFNIPNVVEFCDSALFNCWTKSITMSNNLKRIGNDAFRSTAVTQLLMPNSVEEIGSRFLANSRQLDSLRLSSAITEIPDYGLGWVNARYIVLPYGVQEIGKYAFYSDVLGELAEPVRENVVVIPSSIWTIDADAFKYARHLDAIFLNLDYDVFPGTVKANWLRRGSDYSWSGHKLFVPTGQIEQYRNDPGIKACWRAADIQAGAFDFTATNNFWGSQYRMTVVSWRNKTAKYVYNWGTSGTTISVSNYQTDRLTGQQFKMVEIGDSCWTNRPGVTSVAFSTNSLITKIGAYAFENCTNLNSSTELTIPESVTEIGDRAFYGCTNLQSVFVSGRLATVGNELFSNPTNTTFWVNIDDYGKILKNTTQSWLHDSFEERKLMAYVKPEYEWTALTLPVSDHFFLPKTAQCYTVDYYNQKRDLFFLRSLSTSLGVKGFMGVLMKGTPGTVYRFQTPSEASTTSVTSQTSLLKGIGANGLSYDSQNNFIYRHSGYSNEFISGLGGHTAFGETYLEVPKDADGSYPGNIKYGGIISNYNLWVANTRLHNGNYDELNRISGVTGGVEYDPDSKMLTLNNASITTPTLGVYQQMGDLTLVVEGTNTIRTNTTGGDINRGVYVRQFDNLTISGPGALRVTAEDGTAVEGGSITIDGGVQLTAAGRSVSYNGIGIIHHTNLTISGAATVVNATGDDKSVVCSVADGGTITLNDGIALTAPAGARIYNGTVCAASNTTPISNAWVKFNKLLYAKGDINGDGSVNSADITALSNYVIGRTTAADLKGDLDVNGDGFINVADVAAIIRIIVGK